MRKVSRMILILFVLVAMLISINTSVYATEIQNVVTITDTGSNSATAVNQVNSIGTENTTNDTNTANTIVIENEVPEADIPETGRAEDTVLIVLIAVVAISSIYTYIKVRKYNI